MALAEGGSQKEGSHARARPQGGLTRQALWPSACPQACLVVEGEPGGTAMSGKAWGSRSVDIFEKVEQVGEGTYG